MTFEDNCKRFNIDPVKLCFCVTPDVYNELVSMAASNECELDDFLRGMVDWFILNQPS